MADELVFTCINSGRIAAWDVSSGAVRRNYSGDIDGGGCVCLLGKDFLLCALRSVPFIYVWNVRKVSTFAITVGLGRGKCKLKVDALVVSHVAIMRRQICLSVFHLNRGRGKSCETRWCSWNTDLAFTTLLLH